MGLVWSSERGKVDNIPDINEEKDEISSQDDSHDNNVYCSDSNCEESFYETVENQSSNSDILVQELDSENDCKKELHETLFTASDAPHEEKIPHPALQEISSNIHSFNTAILRKSPVASTVCTANKEDRNCSVRSTEKWRTKWRDPPLVEDEDGIIECSTFSLPLISEDKLFQGRHVSKSISEPAMSLPVNPSHHLRSEAPPSCAWQVDIDCFKSKKRKKPPKKYLRAKDEDLQADYDETNVRYTANDKRGLYKGGRLASAEIATQEMMAGRKVLDLRRW